MKINMGSAIWQSSLLANYRIEDEFSTIDLSYVTVSRVDQSRLLRRDSPAKSALPSLRRP